MVYWTILNSVLILATLVSMGVGIYLLHVAMRRRKRMRENPRIPTVLVYSVTRAIRQEICFLILRVVVVLPSIVVLWFQHEPPMTTPQICFHMSSLTSRILVVAITAYMSIRDLFERRVMHQMMNEQGAEYLRRLWDEMERSRSDP